MSDDNIDISDEYIRRVTRYFSEMDTDQFPLTFLTEGLRNQRQTNEDGEPLSLVEEGVELQYRELERMQQEHERIQQQEMEESLRNLEDESSNITTEEYEFARNINNNSSSSTAAQIGQLSGLSGDGFGLCINTGDISIPRLEENYEFDVLFLGGPLDGQRKVVNEPIFKTYHQPKPTLDPESLDREPREEQTLVINEEGKEEWVGWREDLEPKISIPEEVQYDVKKVALDRSGVTYTYIGVLHKHSDDIEGKALFDIVHLTESSIASYEEIEEKCNVHHVTSSGHYHFSGSLEYGHVEVPDEADNNVSWMSEIRDTFSTMFE